MGISGSFYGSTSNGAIKPKISWSAQENIQGNYSDVTAKLSYSRTDSYTTYGHWEGSLTINGSQKTVSGKYVEITKNSNTVTITHTVRVPHNDDGTKTITISAAGSIPDTTLAKTTISGKVKLTAIPRAASIAAADADIGSVAVVTIGKKSDSYTYTVAYRFGSLTGYLSENGLSDTPVFLTAACLPFPVPEDFYYEIPDKATDSCILTCTTWLDDTAVGEPQQTSFAVRANPDRCGPLLTATVTDINPDTLALTGDAEMLVRYVSTALCTMEAQAQYGASITEQWIGDQLAEGGNAELGNVQADTVRFLARDSRGYTAQQILSLRLVPYFVPMIRLNAARIDATSGNVKFTAQGSFYSGSFGAADNFLQVRCQVNGGEWITLAPDIDGDAFFCEGVLTGLDYTQSHRIALEVSDTLNKVMTDVVINPGIPTFDWGRDDFAFNVPVYYLDKLLEDWFLRKTGDTMDDNLTMGGNRIIGLGEPSAAADAVTKAYADGKVSARVVWEDENPTGFAAQKIECDLSSAQMVGIEYAFSAGSARRKMAFGVMNSNITLDIISKSFFLGTRIAVPTVTGVSFGEAAYNGTGSSVDPDEYILPVRIYSITGIPGLPVVSVVSAICGTFLCGELICGQ